MRLKYLSAAISLLVAGPAFGLTLKLDSRGLKPEHIAPVQRFIEDAQRHLPPTLKTRLQKDLVVSFAKLSEFGQTHTRSANIYLAAHLIPNITAGPQRSALNQSHSTHHKNYYDIALGTLIHEVSHQYDYNAKDVPGEKERRRCLALKNEAQRVVNRDKIGMQLPRECHGKTHFRHVSDNPKFIYALAWGEKEIENKEIEADDQVHRSPNPYEFKSKAEAFAVNFEFFMMDPEYKCRRPTAFNFLKDHFNHDPFPASTCEAGKEVVVNLSTALKNTLNFEQIDVSRVYEVHYLLAGEGASMMSNWGHSMLRLVICAPHRKALGPECLQDIAYHRVVSYRAGVSDLAIDTWKGLSGGYASQIFMLPLLNVINEYTKLEMRDIFSYPLNLTRPEVEDFVTRVIEQFWGYRGKYYFVTNNCAVETFNLVKSIRPNNIEFAAAKTLTPKGVRDLLIRHGISRHLTPQDFASKVYFWPSKTGKFQFYLKEINELTGLNILSVQAFLEQSAAEDRRVLEALKVEKKGLSSFLVLEMVKLEKMVMRKNMVLLDHESKDSNSILYKLVKARAKDSFALVGEYYKSGYGIPDEAEVAASVKAMADAEASQTALEKQQLFESEMVRVEGLALQLLGAEFVENLKQAEALSKESVSLIKEFRKQK